MTMARPLKKDQPLCKVVTVRLTETEFGKFEAKVKAAGMDRNDFFRDVVLQNKTEIRAIERPSKLIPDDKRKLIRYYQAASNNLNQIAARLNIDNKKGIVDDQNYVDVLESLCAIERMLSENIK
jgi:hypothetical protein